MPSREDWKRMLAPILRGTALGSLLGILPGGGALLASFAAYALEKKVSPHGPEFGTGAIEGVAAPESANNAGAQTSFIPMLTLGIPSNPVMALMIGAMIIQGIRPGPNVMVEQPKLFWGVIASMWVGNLLLLVLNLPLIGLWVRLLTIPYHLLYPIILVFSAVGVLSLSNAPVDVHLMALFGVLGYVFAKLDCEPAPLLLGLHPGADDGGIPAPRHDALARRPDDLPRAPDQRGDAGAGGAGNARRRAAGRAQDARQGVRGVGVGPSGSDTVTQIVSRETEHRSAPLTGMARLVPKGAERPVQGRAPMTVLPTPLVRRLGYRPTLTWSHDPGILSSPGAHNAIGRAPDVAQTPQSFLVQSCHHLKSPPCRVSSVLLSLATLLGFTHEHRNPIIAHKTSF